MLKVIKGNIRVKGKSYRPGEVIEGGLLSKDEVTRLITEGYVQFVEDFNDKIEISNKSSEINIDFNPDEVIKPKKGRK